MPSRLALFAFALGCALPILSACGSPQQASSLTPAGAGAENAARARLLAFFQQRQSARLHYDREASWMSPRAVQAKNLVYVADGGRGKVRVYTYPSLEQAGNLLDLADPAGVCSDSKGNVWVVESKAPKLIEYAHGSTKEEAMLSDAGAQYPLGCSVDPTTGNLAMTNLGGPSGGGNILIWAGAKGSATTHSDSDMSFVYFCGYDAQGNLFVDGLDAHYNFVFAELPNGSKDFQTIALDGVSFPGGIAWDGQYVAVGDQAYQSKEKSAIDQVSVSGSTATIAATTTLNGSCDVMQFAMFNGKVFTPDVCLGQGFVYHYPAGGNAIKKIGNLQYPVAAAISSIATAK
ncbi:MAG TPA: hypothetical protein VGI19_13880 [Candidatus Cybelea sp.]